MTNERATGRDVILAIGENMGQSLEPLVTKTLAPSLYQVYLHAEDHDHLRTLFPQLEAEAKRLLDGELVKLNRGALPKMARLAARLGKKERQAPAGTMRYESAEGKWTIRFQEDPNGALQPGEIEVVSEFAQVPAAAYGIVELAVHIVVKGKFPLLANSSRNLTVPFTAMIDALKFDISHINTAHLSPIDIALLEYAALGFFVLAGLAVLLVTTAPGHERLAFVFFVLQLGLLSSQIWTSTFGDGRSLIEPYLMALILLLATPRHYLSWRYLGLIVACVAPALAIVARRRILYM